jgi:hypothetical protein
MINLGVKRQREKTEPRGRAASGDGPTRSGSSAMHKITAFIPSEIIGIYVAGFGILSPETYRAKWWIFGICILLIPIIITLEYLLRKKQLQEEPLCAKLS